MITYETILIEIVTWRTIDIVLVIQIITATSGGGQNSFLNGTETDELFFEGNCCAIYISEKNLIILFSFPQLKFCQI